MAMTAENVKIRSESGSLDELSSDATLLDIFGIPRGLCCNSSCNGCAGFARQLKPAVPFDAQLLHCLRCGCSAKLHRPLTPHCRPFTWPRPLDTPSSPSFSRSSATVEPQSSKHTPDDDSVCWSVHHEGVSLQLGDVLILPSASADHGKLGVVRELRPGDKSACLVVPFAGNSHALAANQFWLPTRDAKLLAPECPQVDVVPDFESEECFKDIVFQPSGLQPLAAALRKRKCRICVLGGSISLQKAGYRPNLVKALERRGVVVEDLHAAIGTAGSKPLSLCVNEKVIAKKPDLLLIEAAVNDGDELLERTPDADMVGVLRAAEGIVRTVRRKSPETVIVFVEMFLRDDTEAARVLKTGSEAWCDAQTHNAIGWYHNVAPRLHQQVCIQYGLTQINLIPAMRSLSTERRQEWFRDDCHHSDVGGEKLGALVAKLILWAVRQAKKPSIPPRQQLAPPLDAQCWFNGRTIRIASGWISPPFTTHREKDALSFGEQADWMLLCVGGKVTIPFKGRTCGLLTILGPDAPIIRISVDGSHFKRIVLLDHWCYYWRDAVILVCEGLTDQTHMVVIEVDEEAPDHKVLKRQPKTPHWDRCKEEAQRAGRAPQRLWLQYACAVEGERI